MLILIPDISGRVCWQFLTKFLCHFLAVWIWPVGTVSGSDKFINMRHPGELSRNCSLINLLDKIFVRKVEGFVQDSSH